MNKSIMDDAKLHQTMSYRLAGVNDLIAAESKYDLLCLSVFRRKIINVKDENRDCDLAMIWLHNELDVAANKGYMLEMSKVWKRYCILAEESGTEIPASFLNRSTTFKNKLQTKVHHIYVIVPKSYHGLSEHTTIFIPVLKVTEENDGSDEDEDMTIPKYNPGDIFLSLVHVALKLRGDILAQVIKAST